MENFSVMMAVCLLAGLSECQTGGEDNQTQITELTHEDLADTWVEQDALQNLETPTILTTASTATQPSCNPPIYTVLKELGALGEKLAATARALEETNKRLEASEKKLSALENSAEYQAESVYCELTSNLLLHIISFCRNDLYFFFENFFIIRVRVNLRCCFILKDRIMTYSRFHLSGRSRIAFSATFSIDGTIGPVNVLYALVYNHVLFNTGGHYSPVTGYFTAPMQGAYYFTFTSFVWSGSSGGSLYRNGNQIVSWYGTLNHSRSRSNSAILQLQVGDHVNVRLWGNRMISGHPNHYSTFSGFLIFPV
ncbi:uncharacterized protein LOC142950629 [Anarhichas minor]|uniref:uncharacterized protein LOC142950629 n=1 Tax=Anarhichas minor TaxID=65739 RepID=UPI003F734AD2